MNILQTKSKRFKDKVKNAPLLPGCYIYRDSDKKIIYVGKAKKLKNRVNSYFVNFNKLEIRKQSMIEHASDVEFITVDSEVDALILESNLIKKYHPKYNILMRDDKSYIYIRFEKIRRSNQPIPTKNSVYQDFPRMKITRDKKDDGADYFGPYPDSMPAKRILKRIRKVFPYRTTNRLVYVKDFKTGEIYTDSKKPCFYYHIGRCDGACAGLEKKSHYIKKYKDIKLFFSGDKKSIINQLERELKEKAKNLEFEEAAKLRDKIQDIKYVTANIRVNTDIDDVKIEELQKEQKEKAIDGLIENLEFPPDKLNKKKNFRIECYDISNIQGTNAVGSMVVMIDGVIKPKLYRKFKIRMKNEPNDFGMLREVLMRRFRQFIMSSRELDQEEFPKNLVERAKNWKKDESFSQKPDLIIIDGGKGQLSSTYKILYSFGLHNEIPIVGLAKREEEIFKISQQFKDENFNQINDSEMFDRILLPRKSESLYMIQRIRDEAHRFAITYHRKLRSKQSLKS